jgi:hypothetical protein
MRAVLFGIALALGLAIAIPAPVSALDVSSTAIAADSSSTVAAADFQPDGKDLKVDINVNRGGDGRWYANPVWMAIGGLAVLVLLVLIVMAVRGGGTTIVKE